jgi:hypothetical protein
MMKAVAACACLAAVLFSQGCAGAPSSTASAPLRVELFDSAARAATDPAGQPLPDPEPPAEETAMPAVAPAVASPTPQSAAPAHETPDVSLVTPMRPRLRATVAMSLPEAPAVGAAQKPVAVPASQTAPAAAGSTTAPATAVAPATAASSAATTPAAPAKSPSPATGKKASTSTAAGKLTLSGSTGAASASGAAAQSTTAGSGAAAASAAGSTAVRQSGDAAPAASPDAGSAASYGKLREIYARQGDELQVGLDGTGFLFLGFTDATAKSQGMSFKSKENRGGKTWFTFTAMKIGVYDLDFLKQDNAAGTSVKETVRVHVVSDQDFNDAVSQQPSAGGAAEEGDPDFAVKLTGLGSYESAVAELLKGYREGNPALNDQIAQLYLRMESWEAAAKYWQKNLSPRTAFTPAAVLGLVRVAVAQKDQPGFMAVLKQFLALSGPPTEEPLILAARMEQARGEIGVGLELAGEYVKRFPDGAWCDEADFMMGQMLEADSAFRDIARARGLYAGILKNRPESPYAEAARERLRYIERHFFQVR